LLAAACEISLAEAAEGGEAIAAFARSGDLRGAEFTGVDLRGARFAEADLSGVVMRGVNTDGVDIDDPFLCDGGSYLRVNGVDVTPFVEAELNRRFPGRAARRVAEMPAGTADVPVGGEWSFTQTLRHLVLATDMWLGRAVLQIRQPFHPIGLLDAGTVEDGFDMSVFTTVPPSYAEVLEVRAGRVAMVRGFLAAVTLDVLAAPRENPHGSGRPETVRSCLHVILREEWEHLRYAVRDLDGIEAERAG
jgi:DinB superfamily/Pentapeptide repeats (8 copies)